MIKTILVPQDGSVYGKSALDYSIWLSSKFGAGLVGMNVVDVVSLEGPFLHDISGSLGFEPFMNFSTRMREALEARGKTILSAFEDTCKENGTRCETQITFGVVANEIVDKAKVADLVVIGRRGVNAQFEYGLLGSTTESVLRRSPKPVLIVPERFSEPKKPLLAYDGSPNASRAMHSAAEWAKTLDLSLTVLTVSSSEEEDPILNDARSYLRPYGIQASFVHRKGDAPIVIENYYKDNGHDLLFMGTSHHSRLVEMVLGSTTEHVMRTVPGPFFLER
ncbi:MAG: universal stress protein [Deltaproteobacteria bacterium]|nr:universal stress protein [Deltaproteobacteria bacterium]MCL4873804.1 universal stress protein [bacterium]